MITKFKDIYMCPTILQQSAAKTRHVSLLDSSLVQWFESIAIILQRMRKIRSFLGTKSCIQMQRMTFFYRLKVSCRWIRLHCFELNEVYQVLPYFKQQASWNLVRCINRQSANTHLSTRLFGWLRFFEVWIIQK